MFRSTRGVTKERFNTVGSVPGACCVTIKGRIAGSRVVDAGCVAKERLRPGSRVLAARCVVIKCLIADGSGVVGGIKRAIVHRLKTDGRVGDADCVAK